jgi:septum formation protein
MAGRQSGEKIMKIILASKSPRRKEILQNHGIDPVIMPTDTDESLPEGLGMTESVELLASRKAEACYEYIMSDPELRSRYASRDDSHNDSGKDGYLIIGSDTIIWKDEIMGKPADHDDAFRMLDKIRGTHHYVVTGVCLIDAASGEKTVLSDTTTVYCVNYSDDDIIEYISGEEPYDKAGSYAIQGKFGKYIDHIDGDYENVVGLPFYRIKDFL